ncbi:MAG: YqaJ viral recombinase family protein [archaeon]|nr:YqaJ viral recombinase family protein [archaeon]
MASRSPRGPQDGRVNIIEFDDEDKVVVFDVYRKKKITGTRLGPILGMSEFATPFKICCEMAGLYPGDKTTKYMEAGNIIEPLIRNYVRKNAVSLLEGPLGTKTPIVEEPVDRVKCSFDHFHDNKVFGGLVDGYISFDGKRQAILEIKTSHDKEKWLDENGNVTVVPESYIMQAGLYAELSKLDRIVFAVGFLEEEDYDRPAFWVPTPENTYIIVIDKPDMTKHMADAEEWYHRYLDAGETPAWTDADAELVAWLKSYKPKKR